MDPQSQPPTPNPETPNVLSEGGQTLQEIENGMSEVPTTPPPLQDSTGTPQLEASPSMVTAAPKRRKSGALTALFVLLSLIVGAGAGIALYKMYFEPKSTSASTQATSSATTQPSVDTAALALAQNNKIIDAVAHVRQVISAQGVTEGDDSSAQGVVHRKLGHPYNFYAEGTAKSMWSITTVKIAPVSKATELAKTIYTYFTTTLGAKADVLVGDANLALSGDAGVNILRLSTDSFSCGFTEEATTASASPYAVDGGTVGLACSTVSEYERNAAVQQPFYKAILADSKNKVDSTMLSMPRISESNTVNYRTAILGVNSDSAMVGGAAGLFYRTPDETWHFLRTSQDELQCSEYSSTDLKKAYAGTKCYVMSTNSEATVTP